MWHGGGRDDGGGDSATAATQVVVDVCWCGRSEGKGEREKKGNYTNTVKNIVFKALVGNYRVMNSKNQNIHKCEMISTYFFQTDNMFLLFISLCRLKPQIFTCWDAFHSYAKNHFSVLHHLNLTRGEKIRKREIREEGERK